MHLLHAAGEPAWRARARLAPQDPGVPLKWLADLFDKYVPDTLHEMKRAFSHITPLGTMNFVT